MGEIGFSLVGLAFLLALVGPNLIWALAAKPNDYDTSSENRVLRVLERVGQVATTAAALLFADTNLRPWTPWSWWLVAAITLMVASLPVAAFLLLGIYGRVVWLIAAVVILGIGHVGIHLQHARECRSPKRGDGGVS